MKVQPFFHRPTGTLTYLVSSSTQAAVIDPVLGYSDGSIDDAYLKQIIQSIQHQSLNVKYILETHIHADHLSGAKSLQAEVGGQIGISERINDVYRQWEGLCKGKPIMSFDILLNQNMTLKFGNEEIEIIETPGHTPTDITYKIGNNIFVGDTLFSPKRGTGRADFPEGSAESQYNSIMALFRLGDTTKVYLCHDYPNEHEEPEICSTVQIQKSDNIMLNNRISEHDYVLARQKRDESLPTPKLLNVAIPFNLTGSLIS
ncbi:MBL fold metallo-hydrolase [Vibrio marisflavi]|uniref:Metallo-hydrolase n=1 Tax=Vibrio marisflavi CECT 7928 TaxID=634439 RepID=A0ABM9A3K0_9VIBR|nr:MBL fold metallo-hydrolase [Vibrio marisflavi]CAH0539295.1 putative metallo-hydrolase [Vibrio marisflavi CECT 7928]